MSAIAHSSVPRAPIITFIAPPFVDPIFVGVIIDDQSTKPVRVAQRGDTFSLDRLEAVDVVAEAEGVVLGCSEIAGVVIKVESADLDCFEVDVVVCAGQVFVFAHCLIFTDLSPCQSTSCPSGSSYEVLLPCLCPFAQA